MASCRTCCSFGDPRRSPLVRKTLQFFRPHRMRPHYALAEKTSPLLLLDPFIRPKSKLFVHGMFSKWYQTNSYFRALYTKDKTSRRFQPGKGLSTNTVYKGSKMSSYKLARVGSFNASTNWRYNYDKQRHHGQVLQTKNKTLIITLQYTI